MLFGMAKASSVTSEKAMPCKNRYENIVFLMSEVPVTLSCKSTFFFNIYKIYFLIIFVYKKKVNYNFRIFNTLC